ncbi:MAG: ANL family adenylate-forming protein [Polaribacter sp.]
MGLFWIESNRNLEVSYNTFFNELIKEGENNVYVKHENPYIVFLNLIRNCISGKKSIILDSDFSEVEMNALEISNDVYLNGKFVQPNLSESFQSFEDIISFLKAQNEKLEIDIYTSGTTGRPKKITQRFKNLTRAVKERESLQKCVWGFAYNPTHFAGLQVFFQALYNQNKIVYIFNKGFEAVYNDFLDYQITHLSCTPTFMKMLLPLIKTPINSVESLTFGGEKFEPSIEKIIKNKFPKATIKNVYASTEAGSLLKAEGEYFLIPSRYKDLIRIENNELLIHKELLGTSKSFNLEGDWYQTGDIVEFLDNEKFKFKNRKSEMINVGGYKVNPSEVEAIIKEIEGVQDVIVFGRDNSVMGKIVVAHVIKNESEDKKELKNRIKEITKSKLQDYKLPRLIKFVDAFELTRTGKIKR